MSAEGKRRIARNACTWCGHVHPPGRACKAHIQTGIERKNPVTAPCPCTRHLTRLGDGVLSAG